jgi:Mrp family chromosome partitioning ATPase
MDQIRKAIERAKAASTVSSASRPLDDQPPEWLTKPAVEAAIAPTAPTPASANIMGIRSVQIERATVEGHRIVAHNPGDSRSKSFDMLRTQTLQGMDQSHWQLLGITSPTPGCGKTLTAVNLAYSIARQPERSVLLVDLDLYKPQVAHSLGLRPKAGVVGVLEGRSKLKDALLEASTGNLKMLVLPAETRVVDTTELVASRALPKMLQDIKHNFPRHTIIIDLPPLLSSDDVIAVLPYIDCVHLVAAVGTSTISEMKECGKHLQSCAVLRIVLNKAADSSTGYYSGAA